MPKKSIALARNPASLRSMNDKPKPSLAKIFLLPVLVATILAIVIGIAAPQLGIYAWGSAWFGTFFMLSVWNIITAR